MKQTSIISVLNVITKRFPESRSYLQLLFESLISLLAGFLVGGIIIYFAGFSPLLFYEGMFVGAFGTTGSTLNTLSYMTPLILTGLSFAIAARASLFNIGAEGQMYLGAFITVLAGYYLRFPIILHPIIIISASVLSGGFYGVISGWLRISRGVNEVISTIMLNWVAFYLVNYLTTYYFYNPSRPYETPTISDSAKILPLFAGTTLSYTFFISLLVAILFYIILWRTIIGYNIRTVGINPSASEYGGINVKRTIIIAMFLSGGTAGLAGSLEVLGRFGNIDTGLNVVKNLGFDGIAVSLIGRNHPIGIILSSLFFAMLKSGIVNVQAITSVGGKTGVPLELGIAVQGAIIMFSAIPSMISLIKKWRR
ncbi:MAG: ABC transporter permease [Thermoprotei archaeon]